jgi:hypothetical protein
MQSFFFQFASKRFLPHIFLCDMQTTADCPVACYWDMILLFCFNNHIFTNVHTPELYFYPFLILHNQYKFYGKERWSGVHRGNGGRECCCRILWNCVFQGCNKVELNGVDRLFLFTSKMPLVGGTGISLS